MKQSKSIAVLLLAVMPGNAFAQTLPADVRAAAFRDQIARGSILDKWDPTGYAPEFELEQATSCESSKSEGRTDAADQHGSAGWFLGGIGAGVGLGLIGTGAIVGGSALTNPQPKSIKPGQDESCYRDGYSSKAKNKNMISSLLGGLAGTAAWFAIYFANADE